MPAGALVDSAWFERHNISNQSVYGYVNKGLLVRLSRGVFLLKGNKYDSEERLDWEVVLASLNRVMNVQFHVGGVSSIQLFGKHHFGVFSSIPDINVYGQNLPGWLKNLDANGKFRFVTNNLFRTANLGIEHFKQRRISFGYEVTYPVSGFERAILEMIDSIKNESSFEHVDLVFESLFDLDPELLTQLLLDCRKFKVRRLFLVFAERHQHEWLKEIDKSKIELGTHSRQFIRDGRYHPEYKITVPRYILPREDEICTL